ncbi:hypothetical protein [Ralstonia phage RP31]|uniref:Uncharacterized protein n=1 Tax=Ralstonia phage RP31 TaxID=1923890 RepID=A0A1L7N241_9CAUD|nr:hypothetical protein [Ralstonia phage RP31]
MNFGNNNFGSLDAQFGSGQQQNLGGLSGGFTPQPQVSLIQQTYDFGQAIAENQQQGAMTMEIRKIYLGLTRPQANQFRRTYDVMLDGQGMSAIQNEVERQGAEAFNPANMSNLMAQGANFIRHSGTPDGAVNIENGWETERFRFTMVVDVYRNGKFQRTEFISGSTDEAAASNMGMTNVFIDPNMLFTINHVTEARQRQLDNLGRPIPMISRSNAVVRNSGFGGLGTQSSMFLTRPSDVLRAVDKVQLYRGMEQAAQFGEPTAMTYQDLDSMLTSVPMMSADTNLLVPTFASRTLKGLYENSLSSYDPMNIDNMGGGALAGQRIQDTAFSQSGFIHVMNRKLANGVATTAQFTFGDLLKLDLTIDDRTEVFGRAYENGAISIPDGRSVANIGDAEVIALHATSIVQSTLALMSMSGVAVLAYNANNLNTGDTEVTIQACDGMDNDGMLFQRLEVLKGRLIMECLSIVAAEETSYEVDVFADAFNDVFVEITWGGIHRAYVIPAFASSSLAPVVTNSLDRLIGMAETIDDVIDTCKQIIAPGSTLSTSDGIAVQGAGESRWGGLAGDY